MKSKPWIGVTQSLNLESAAGSADCPCCPSSFLSSHVSMHFIANVSGLVSSNCLVLRRPQRSEIYRQRCKSLAGRLEKRRSESWTVLLLGDGKSFSCLTQTLTNSSLQCFMLGYGHQTDR